MLIQSMNFNMDVAGQFSVLLILSVLGLVLNGAVSLVRRRVLFWDTSRDSDAGETTIRLRHAYGEFGSITESAEYAEKVLDDAGERVARLVRLAPDQDAVADGGQLGVRLRDHRDLLLLDQRQQVGRHDLDHVDFVVQQRVDLRLGIGNPDPLDPIDFRRPAAGHARRTR